MIKTRAIFAQISANPTRKEKGSYYEKRNAMVRAKRYTNDGGMIKLSYNKTLWNYDASIEYKNILSEQFRELMIREFPIVLVF